MAWHTITAWLTCALLLVPLPALGADPLVVSVWGGNWKDTVERVVAKPFTARTGIPVEFEVGGTLDRLAKARVSKAAPLVDITLTTTHVGRLYISDGLFEKLDMAKLPNARELAREAIRSDHHVGVWAYVYTIAYRPDLDSNELWETIGAGATIVDPDIKPQSTDEFVLGGEYEMFANARLGLAYTRRTIGRVIEDMSRDDGSTYFIGNPGYGFAKDFIKPTRSYDAVTMFFSRPSGLSTPTSSPASAPNRHAAFSLSTDRS